MRGSKTLGLALIVGVAAVLAACVPAPVQAPADPDIPGQSTPAFPNLTNPPTTAGPSDPPVPTDAPGAYSYGQSVTIHTSQGTTWRITPLANVDPADTVMAGQGASPARGSRFVILSLRVENVGVVATHPFYDMMFAYQPANAPLYDQNTGGRAGSPNDLGYIRQLAVGESVTAEVVVQVPANAPQGAWVISGDNQQTFYRFS